MISSIHIDRVHRPRPRAKGKREQGLALVMTLTAVAILAVLLADMHENGGTAFTVASNQRDELRAEYMAKSGLNLTRLLVAQERPIRQIVAPFYQIALGRAPSQIPVWKFANEILQPFCDYESAKGTGVNTGIDFGSVDALNIPKSRCEIVSFAENSKININNPLLIEKSKSKLSLAMQLFALLGGYQPPGNSLDALFDREDPDGNRTARLDVVSAIIDWWDEDTDRTTFDPGRGEVVSGGTEDDVYASFDDPYRVKNAPFDTLEELRLIRGVGDDFWATFVDPDPESPDARAITVYGSGLVNANEAPPAVLLARLCSYVPDQPLCVDPLEAAKFVQLLDTVRGIIPIPFFARPADFLTFVQGQGGPNDLYPMLKGFLGPDNPLLFKPLTMPANKVNEASQAFVTSAEILFIQSTGIVCERDPCTTAKISAVVNFHDRWTPAPPNTGRMPGLGVLHYYKID